MPETFQGPRLPTRWVVLATLARHPDKPHTRAAISAELESKVQHDTLRALEPWVMSAGEVMGPRNMSQAWQINPVYIDDVRAKLRELVALLYPPPPGETIELIRLSRDAIQLAHDTEERNIRLTELAISCGASADELADARGDS